MSDLLVIGGAEVKARPGGAISGFGIVYSGPDSPDKVGDFFSEVSDLGLRGRSTVPLYWDHCLGTEKGELAQATFLRGTKGILFSALLDMDNASQREIWRRASHGELGFSTGAPPHLVQRVPTGIKGVNWLKRWPVAEISLTPTPCEPRCAVEVKSLLAARFEEDDEIPIEARVIMEQVRHYEVMRELHSK